MMITKYAVKNAKGTLMNRVNTEAEANAIVAKANARGWNWTIKAYTENYLTNDAEVWEIEGGMADPNEVEWNEEEI